jgi:hypothetical protein
MAVFQGTLRVWPALMSNFLVFATPYNLQERATGHVPWLHILFQKKSRELFGKVWRYLPSIFGSWVLIETALFVHARPLP